MNLDVREMRQVAAIASEGSFARAARALHISQPALSRSIQEVERKTGFKIFERGREGAMITDAGRAFMLQASDILALADNMERELALIKGLDVGEVCIGVGIYVSEIFVSEAIAQFAKPHTQTRIRLLNEPPNMIAPRLRRREVDLAVGDPAWLEPATDIRVTRLNQHQGYLVARGNHPLFAKRGLTLKEVLPFPFVTMALMPNRLALMGKQLKGAELEQQRWLEKWNPAITVNSITSMKVIAAASDAIALVSLKMVRHELERGDLAVLPFDLSWMRTNFAIMHLAHRTLSPLAQAVTQAIIDEDQRVVSVEKQLVKRWFNKSRGSST